jgi:hypothetical protein
MKRNWREIIIFCAEEMAWIGSASQGGPPHAHLGLSEEQWPMTAILKKNEKLHTG